MFGQSNRPSGLRGRHVAWIGGVCGVLACWMAHVTPIAHAGQTPRLAAQCATQMACPVLASGESLPLRVVTNALPQVSPPVVVIPVQVQRAQVIRPQAPINPPAGGPRRGAVIP